MSHKPMSTNGCHTAIYMSLCRIATSSPMKKRPVLILMSSVNCRLIYDNTWEHYEKKKEPRHLKLIILLPCPSKQIIQPPEQYFVNYYAFSSIMNKYFKQFYICLEVLSKKRLIINWSLSPIYNSMTVTCATSMKKSGGSLKEFKELMNKEFIRYSRDLWAGLSVGVARGVQLFQVPRSPPDTRRRRVGAFRT